MKKFIKVFVLTIPIFLIFNFGLLFIIHGDLAYNCYKYSDGKVLHDAKEENLVQSEGDFFKKYLDAFDITIQKAYVTKHFGAFFYWTFELNEHRRIYVTLDRNSSFANEIQEKFVFKFERDNNAPSNYYDDVLVYKINDIAIFHAYPKEYQSFQYKKFLNKYQIGTLKIKVEN